MKSNSLFFLLLRFIFGFLVLQTGLLLFTQTYADAPAITTFGAQKANENGYIDGTVCADCHKHHYDGFQHVGMSQSFKVADPAHFSAEMRSKLPYYHQKSDRYYDLQVIEDEVFFIRYQKSERQNLVNKISVKIDYILGSGNKAQSFVYRTESDELYELPINWYSESESWGMAPGYDLANHSGIYRQITTECIFCHNAYPLAQEEEPGFKHHHRFPKTLPQGIDCQRCHGPGQSHVEAAKSENSNLELIRDMIVNPAKLAPEARDSVCFQCHLLPSVSLTGLRRFERSVYSFRPGEPLSDYFLHFDIEDAHISKEDRFEINHQAYRLQESQCFEKSDSALTCISCHNPHVKPEESVFKQQVKQVCLDCHSQDPDFTPHIITHQQKECVDCHMPQRRTQDVVHVVMTDHKIGIYPDLANLLVPLEEDIPEILDLILYDDDLKMDRTERDIYKLSTILRATPSKRYAKYLTSLLQRTQYNQLPPYLDLADSHLKLKDYEEAIKVLKFANNKFGQHPQIEKWLALAFVATNQEGLAEEKFQRLLAQEQKDADVFYNYGVLLFKKAQYSEAEPLFRKASELRSNFIHARYYLALTQVELNRIAEAISLLQATIAIEPGAQRLYIKLAELYQQTGKEKKALQIIDSGIQYSDESDKLSVMKQSTMSDK